MKSKQRPARKPGKGHKLHKQDDDSNLIGSALKNAGKWNKDKQSISKFTSKGDTVL